MSLNGFDTGLSCRESSVLVPSSMGSSVCYIHAPNVAVTGSCTARFMEEVEHKEARRFVCREHLLTSLGREKL